MSYRIWINAFDMSFMSTRTESNKDAAEGIARALARNNPGAVVGVDSIESESVFRNAGQGKELFQNGAPKEIQSKEPSLTEVANWLRNGAGEKRARGTAAFEEGVLPLYRELADKIDAMRKARP